MRFDILTLFPEMFAPVQSSMIGRAEKNGLIDFNIVNIRDFSQDKHKKTDDAVLGKTRIACFSVKRANHTESLLTNAFWRERNIRQTADTISHLKNGFFVLVKLNDGRHSRVEAPGQQPGGLLSA